MTKTQAIIYLSERGIDDTHINLILDAFSQEPQFFPPCLDCVERMNEIRKAYDNLKTAENASII